MGRNFPVELVQRSPYDFIYQVYKGSSPNLEPASEAHTERKQVPEIEPGCFAGVVSGSQYHGQEYAKDTLVDRQRLPATC